MLGHHINPPAPFSENAEVQAPNLPALFHQSHGQLSRVGNLPASYAAVAGHSVYINSHYANPGSLHLIHQKLGQQGLLFHNTCDFQSANVLAPQRRDLSRVANSAVPPGKFTIMNNSVPPPKPHHPHLAWLKIGELEENQAAPAR